jgi:hypothetical protein
MTTLIITNIAWDTEGQTRAACRLPEAVIVLDAPEVVHPRDGDDGSYEDIAIWLDEQFGFTHTVMCLDILGTTQNGMLPVTAGRWDVGDTAVLAYTRPADGNCGSK